MNNSKLHILVVGAAGFIGQHLVTRLQQGERFELSLMGHGASCFAGQSGVVFTCEELGSSELRKCVRPDFIFYLAGGSSVAASIAYPLRDFQRSLPPLALLIENLRENWCGSRLVFISSAAVYGVTASLRTNSRSALEPLSPYGLHKKLSELMLNYYADTFGLNVSIVRPFSVFGPGLRKQLLWDALEKAREGDFKFFGTGRELRDWVYVDDLVAFILDIAFNPGLYPRVVNAGTGKGITTAQLLECLYSVADLNEKPIFSEEQKPGDPQHLVADIDEQRMYLDFFSTPLISALENYFDWYRRKGN